MTFRSGWTDDGQRITRVDEQTGPCPAHGVPPGAIVRWVAGRELRMGRVLNNRPRANDDHVVVSMTHIGHAELGGITNRRVEIPVRGLEVRIDVTGFQWERAF
jgi:hypothetical protein